MVSARKRSFHEADGGGNDAAGEPSLLHQIRNMWQFANLCQWIFLFGSIIKVDDNFDVEDLEAECLKPYSTALQDIGLSLLKFLSSHRGLTPDLFDEYTRRQFQSKAPTSNPFGEDETPAKFSEFDVITKIRVLQQMTQFIMMNPDKLRERAQELGDSDQTSWRIEPYGWDRNDRTYYVLDDNRIYRLTEAPLLPAKPKKNSKKARAAERAKKRRRVALALDSDADEAGDEASDKGKAQESPEDDGLGGMLWECLAVTLDEVRQFVSTLQKTRDDNERVLRDQILDHLVPILEKQEESRKRKIQQREKELLSLAKMAHAKRSSRIAHKIEQQKVDELAREEEHKRLEAEAAAKREEQKRLKREKERDNRLMSREARLREREARRRQHAEELAQLSETSGAHSNPAGRLSQRHLEAEIEKKRQALREMEEEEEEWMFDCICGVYGQVDDGGHSVACEKCNTWQHSKCLGIEEEAAERDDFHFVCDSCRRREAAARREQEQPRPRIIKIKVNRPGSSSSPPQPQGHLVVEIPSKPPASPTPATAPAQANRLPEPANGHHERLSSGPVLPSIGPRLPPTGVFRTNPIPTKSSDQSLGQPPVFLNGATGNPFSSSPPRLLPPEQSPNKARAYGTMASSLNGPSESAPAQQDASRLALANASFPQPPVSNHHGSPIKDTSARLVAPMSTAPYLPPATNGSTGPQVQPEAAQALTTHGAPSSSPLLPPSSRGRSPQKHSPPRSSHGPTTDGAWALPRSSPTPAILPPVPPVPPSPQPLILTPPVKPVEPVRPAADASKSAAS